MQKTIRQFIGPFTVLEPVGPVTFRHADMGQRADVVHADRLKHYKSPTKHSICTEHDREDVTQEKVAEKKNNPPKAKKKGQDSSRGSVR